MVVIEPGSTRNERIGIFKDSLIERSSASAYVQRLAGLFGHTHTSRMASSPDVAALRD